MSQTQPTFHGIPRVPDGVLTRDRLVDILDQPSALTIVRGPAGAGKSTLVADWAQRINDTAPAADEERHGAWITLDNSARGDEDPSDQPAGFWQQVLQGLADAGWTDEAPDPVGNATPGSRPDRALIRLFRHLPGRRILVLDNATFADLDVRRRFLAVLAESPRLQCILLTRDSSLSTLNAELMIDTIVIDAEELMLTDDEMQQILAPRVGTTRAAAELVAHIGRLPVTVRAAGLAMQQLSAADDAKQHDQEPNGSSRAALSPVLLEMIISACDDLLLDSAREPEFADFLACTSVATELSVDLASKLSGVVDSVAMLDRAEREGLGRWLPASAERSEREVFRYTSAVRAAVRQQLTQRDPAKIGTLTQTYGRWAESHGWTAVAFRCWIELGDFAAANRVAQYAITDLLQTDAAAIIRLLDAAPRPRLREYPVLVFMLAAAYNCRNEIWPRTAEMYKITISSIRRQLKQAPAPERFLLYTLDAAAHRSLGRLDAAMESTDQAMTLLDQLPVRQRDALNPIVPAALNQNTFGYFRAGRIDRAQHTLCATFALTGTQQRPSQEFYAAALAACIQAVRGDIPGAAKIVSRIKRTWPAEWIDDRRGAMVRVASSIIAVERLDFVQAKEQLDTLTDCYERLELWMPYGLGRGMIAIGNGEPAVGYEQLSALLTSPSAARLTPAERQPIEALMALALYCAGRPQRADQQLQQLGRHPNAVLVRAVAALASNDPEQAMVAANQILPGISSTDPVVHTRWSADSGLVRAAALARLGRKDAACTAVVDAAAELDRSGRRLPLMLLPRADLERLADIATAEGATGVLRVFGNIDAIPDVLSEVRPPVVLTNREQVVLNVLAQTGSVTSIGRELNVSPNTVKTQLRAIYRKLGVRSRSDALLAASEHELLTR